MAIGLRRGLFRIWLLLSAGWIMSWVIGLTMGVLEHGFKANEAPPQTDEVYRLARVV